MQVLRLEIWEFLSYFDFHTLHMYVLGNSLPYTRLASSGKYPKYDII